VVTDQIRFPWQALHLDQHLIRWSKTGWVGRNRTTPNDMQTCVGGACIILQSAASSALRFSLCITMRLSFISSVAVAFVAAACVPGLTAASSADVVHPEVHRRLEASGVASVVISMKEERPSRLLAANHRPLGGSSKTKECESRFDQGAVDSTADLSAGVGEESVAAMVDALEAHAKDQHTQVMKLLASQSSSGSSSSNVSERAYSAASSLWISNTIVVRDAIPSLIDKLASLSSVGSIREELVAHIPITAIPYLSSDDSSSSGGSDIDSGFEAYQQQRRRHLGQALVGEWSVERIHAVDAWQLGWFGNGTRVATIDSGVRSTHSILQDSFLGGFGWFDALEGASTPQDASGHGTGIMGLLVGESGIGVAPGAKWMACRACDAANACREGDLLECAQFLTCPSSSSASESSESSKNCSARPHVINNSWNLDRGTTTFQSAIDVWVAAGIVPVFSAGNEGPSCASVSSPADAVSTSLTVGSTDYSDELSAFSARGPGLSGNVKPDVAAPGETIVSAGYDSDSSLVLLSGTSIAAPHVSGAVAILAGAFPMLSVSEMVQLLQGTASSAVGVTATTQNVSCMSTSSKNSSLPVPNNAFGYGLVDVLKAIGTQQATLAAALT
jgi:subtilisin family serine protease